MIKMLFVIFCILLPWSAESCVYPPKSLYISAQLSIRQATKIVLAKVVKAESNGGENIFWFESIDVLKGEDSGLFKVVVSNALPGSIKPLGEHRHFSFWLHAKGGVGVDSDCKVRPNFRLGHTYLVFSSTLPSLRNYEEVLSDDDKWLLYVKEFLKFGKNITPILNASEFIEQFSSIHIYKCPSAIKSERGRPKLKASIKGEPPKRGPFPRLGEKRCSVGKFFLYLSAGSQYPPLTIPIEDGWADFSYMAKELLFVDSNKLDLTSYF